MVLNKPIASSAILTGGDIAALARIISLIKRVTAEEPEVGAVRTGLTEIASSLRSSQ
jgi:hypothetical protein